jgi:hypothetical protein
LGGWLARDAMSPPQAPGAAPIQTAALAPRPEPVPPPLAAIIAEPAPEAPSGPAVAQEPPDISAAPASPPKVQEPAPEPDGTAMELPAPRRAEAVRTAEIAQPAPDRTAPAVARGCATEPTPADREICGEPELRRLQGELRRAYNEALKAHEDRELLRQRQLAWRDARNTVTDPDRLARLYEQRIRKLNAATAEARQQR